MARLPDFTRGRRLGRTSIPMVLALTLVWVFLWGDLSVGNLLAGLALGLAVMTLLPMPVAVPGRRPVIRPLAAARLLTRFLIDVAVAAVGVAWRVLTNHKPRSAVIRVQMRAHSDAFLTATAGMTSLVPGSIVLDAHRLTGMLYIHVFDIEMSGGLDRAHSHVLEQEERLLRAFGTRDELLDAGYVPGGSTRLGRIDPSQDNSRAQDAPGGAQ